MSAPLSVCVLACNEEADLERCLLSVAWADEIVVLVDDKSLDGTENVARRLASRVERRAYAGDVEQKRSCAALAKHDWILIVDPDEVVSAPLAESIRACLRSESQSESQSESKPAASSGHVGFRVNRATFHLGRWIRHGDFYPDWKLRLYRRSRARWTGRDPHGRIEVDGPVASLEGELLHYSYRDLADQIERIQFFSDQAADALVREGVVFSVRKLVLRPPARFLRSYFLRSGFRDGTPGFIIAVASAFYVFLKYAKHWERSRAPGDGNRRD
jgi:glycosyltransferase involved in cell wall biosynthesis